MSLRGIAVMVVALSTPCLIGAVVSGPVVSGGAINYQTNRLTLAGSGFEPTKVAPTVQSNGVTLGVVSATDSQIVAAIPAGAIAGTFAVTVTTTGGASAVFDMTYGAVGPQGPAGPAGAQGVAGSQGLQGKQGAAGPAGQQGLAGVQGPAGPAGAQGLKGSQGAVGPTGPAGPSGPTGPEGPTGPAAAAQTLVVANQPADVAIPAGGQDVEVNSIVLPNTGTYLIQGEEAFEDNSAVYCYVAATPVNIRFRPSLGLPGFITGSTNDSDFHSTVPIVGYYIAPQAGMTLTLWCRSIYPATAFAQGPGADIAEDHVGSMLTALQVQ